MYQTIEDGSEDLYDFDGEGPFKFNSGSESKNHKKGINLHEKDNKEFVD